MHTMGKPWMLASCHIMAQTTDWVVYLVCRSFSHSEKLCMGPDVNKGYMQMKPAPVTAHWGIWSRWVGAKQCLKKAWSLGVDNTTSLSAGVCLPCTHVVGGASKKQSQKEPPGTPIIFNIFLGKLKTGIPSPECMRATPN